MKLIRNTFLFATFIAAFTLFTTSCGDDKNKNGADTGNGAVTGETGEKGSLIGRWYDYYSSEDWIDYDFCSIYKTDGTHTREYIDEDTGRPGTFTERYEYDYEENPNYVYYYDPIDDNYYSERIIWYNANYIKIGYQEYLRASFLTGKH